MTESELVFIVKNKLMEVSMMGNISNYDPLAEQLIKEISPYYEAKINKVLEAIERATNSVGKVTE